MTTVISEFAQALTNGEYTHASQIDGFDRIAADLGISRIVRIIKRDGEILSVQEFYNDERLDDVCRVVRECPMNDGHRLIVKYSFSENPDEQAPEKKACLDIIYSLLMLAFSRWEMRIEASRSHNLDLRSGIPNMSGFTAFCETVMAEGRISEYAALCTKVKGSDMIDSLFGYNEAAGLLSAYARAVFETMQDDEICARNGAEAFCMLVKKDSLEKHLQNLRGMNISFDIGGERTVYNISMRAGIVFPDDKTEGVNAIVSRAESCLELAKTGGEDFVYYDRNVILREIRLHILEAEMPEAIENGEFTVYFQPKVRVSNNNLVGAEALVRWNKNGTLISPADFIPLAEKTGVIKKLDMYVLRQTCSYMKKWREEGKNIVPVSVNFSKMHLRFPRLAENIMSVINEYDLPPELIEVEFTETAYIDDFNAIKKAIDDLKSYGVMVSMDDFGTGYSSLALLKNLDFDVLKLDKSIVSDNRDDRSRVILESVLKMAKNLSMIVICEGVEEEAVVKQLKFMGCDIIQGYYFDKPLPVDEFVKRLENPVYYTERVTERL